MNLTILYNSKTIVVQNYAITSDGSNSCMPFYLKKETVAILWQ